MNLTWPKHAARMVLATSLLSIGFSVDAQVVEDLREAGFSDRSHAQTTSSKIRAGTQQALESSPHERALRWQQVHRIEADFRQHAGDNPFGLLVTIQFALSEVARAELSREEAEAEQALGGFRSAIRLLHSAETEVDASLRASYQHPSGKTPPTQWTTRELESLKRHLQLELARAFRQQALCYSADSADRLNSLSQALERLRPIVSQPGDEPLFWQARIEQLVCLRLLQRYSEARAQLARWQQERPSAAMQSRLAGEQLRLDLAEDSLDRALPVARKMAADASSESAPETEAAILEVLLVAREQASGEEAGRLARDAASVVQGIAARHGPYWKRRADAALGRALAEDPANNDPELLVRAAASLYVAGRSSDAVEAYDRAAKQFLQAGRSEKLIESAIKAAAILREAGKLSDAATRYRNLATNYPQHPLAPKHHLIAAGLFANLARDLTNDDLAHDTTPAGQDSAREKFTLLLREHLQHWPQSPQADTARWWLARQRMSRRNWPSAIELLSAIAPSSKHSAESVQAMLQCYGEQLQFLEGSTPENALQRRRLTAAATKQLQPIITGTENRWPDRWTALQRTVATAIAEMQLLHVPQGHEYAEKLLTAALAGAAEGEPNWQSRATALLAAAALRNEKLDQGRQLLRTALHENPSAAADLLACMEALQLEAHRQPSPELAKVVVEFVTWAEENSPKAAVANLQEYSAFAHQQLGNRTQALAAYARWTQLQPKNGDAHEAYATLLGQGNEPSHLHKAMALWQEVERRSQPGGDRWTRGRNHRLRLLAQLGKQDQAEKLLRLTRVLYPTFEETF